MTPNVIGVDELLAKKSAVDQSGNLRNQPVDGVIFRPTRPVPHEDGHATEVARASWEILQAPVVQVHITTTFPSRVRAWGLHPLGTDRLFVVSGLKIVVFDGRKAWDLPPAETNPNPLANYPWQRHDVPATLRSQEGQHRKFSSGR